MQLKSEEEIIAEVYASDIDNEELELIKQAMRVASEQFSEWKDKEGYEYVDGVYYCDNDVLSERPLTISDVYTKYKLYLNDLKK